MSMIVDNAIILAAGFASRFLPLSKECPKALLKVKGEVLIERQIRQLQEAGIKDIVVVTGYLKEKFSYLEDAFQVTLVENPEYDTRNNHSSIYAARAFLKNTYICSCDNYFPENLFQKEEERPFYSALYADGLTKEWCLTTDCLERITGVQIGGCNAWYMLGHVFWDEHFSTSFRSLLEHYYSLEETTNMLWEDLYLRHLDVLTLYTKKYLDSQILEFDSLEELQNFDPAYG